MPCWKPTRRQRSSTPSSTASASVGFRSSPSPTSTRAHRPTGRGARASVRTRSSGRLIAVSRPAQPTTNVLRPRPSSRSHARRASSSALPHAGRSKPYGNDDEAVEPARRRSRRGRRALRHSRRPGRRWRGRAAARSSGRPARRLAEVAAQDVAVVGVDDRARPGRPERGRRADPWRRPSRCGCGGRPDAVPDSSADP